MVSPSSIVFCFWFLGNDRKLPIINAAYPMINKQFVIHNASDYKYVDREDDAGVDGLRKAKLSYKPAIIAEKYSAKYIED